MKVRTREERKISDLMHIALLFNQRIVTEIEEIQCGHEKSSKEILEGLEYVIEERFNFMIRDEEKPE